jgi:hypothetical protein
MSNEPPRLSTSQELLETLSVYYLDTLNPTWEELQETSLAHPEIQAISFYSTSLRCGMKKPEPEVDSRRFFYDLVEVPAGACVYYKLRDMIISDNPHARLLPLFKIHLRISDVYIHIYPDTPFKVYSITSSFREQHRKELREKTFQEGDLLFMDGDLFKKITT